MCGDARSGERNGQGAANAPGPSAGCGDGRGAEAQSYPSASRGTALPDDLVYAAGGAAQSTGGMADLGRELAEHGGHAREQPSRVLAVDGVVADARRVRVAKARRVFPEGQELQAMGAREPPVDPRQRAVGEAGRAKGAHRHLDPGEVLELDRRLADPPGRVLHAQDRSGGLEEGDLGLEAEPERRIPQPILLGAEATATQHRVDARPPGFPLDVGEDEPRGEATRVGSVPEQGVRPGRGDLGHGLLFGLGREFLENWAGRPMPDPGMRGIRTCS